MPAAPAPGHSQNGDDSEVVLEDDWLYQPNCAEAPVADLSRKVRGSIYKRGQVTNSEVYMADKLRQVVHEQSRI